MIGWISVKDKLPDLNIEVLLYLNNEIRIGARWDSFDFENDCDSYSWYIPEYFDTISPSHWQPLPEPPKEKENE